jgi:Zn-dependent peptidase ImmA (M78 family)/transcriptional regulator with XRE-family HTH domain
MSRRQFYPEMLILARESRGLTQQDCARDLGISQSEMSKIEAGLREPSSELIARFASLLRYAAGFFFVADRMMGSSSNCAYYRKRKSASLHIIRQALAIANVRRIQISRLLISGSAELDPQNQFRRIDITEHPAGADAIAQTVRTMWSVPPGPVQDLTRIVEDAGGIVFRCNFGSGKIDAMSQWIQSLPPMFFVNQEIPCDRMRWTLAHEIGHVVMHSLPTENIEQEANTFAAEFLMPSREIRPYLTDLSLPKLAAMKPYWKVSMNALLKRACDLGTITERQRSYLWMQMGAHGYRTHEPVPLPQEEPSLVREIVEFHTKELGFSMGELAQLMLMNEDEVRSEFTVSKNTLRRVV